MMTISKCKLLELVIVLLLHWGLATCQVFINGKPYGNITTSNYPNYVTTRNSFLEWMITVGSNQKIKLEIKDLTLSTCHGSCYSGSCSDYFQIIDTYSQNDLALFCSSVSLPKFYYSTGPTIDVTFYWDDTRSANRRLWLYYEAFPKIPSPTTLTTTTTTTTTTTKKGATKPSSNSGKLSTVESTLLVVGIIVSVFLSVLVVFICGVKKRCSRRQQSRRPSSSQTQQNITPPSYEEIELPDQPPSYDEAVRSSRTSLTTLPSYSSPDSSVNALNNNGSTPHVNENEPCTAPNAYDVTGLPSYNEAHRLSQASINRVDDNRV